jgi:hypothetical protein
MSNARDLSNHLAALLREERAALSEFLLALAEFDRVRAWADLGHANLFSFLHRELGLSRGSAHYRKTAAELVQRYPEVLEALRDGRLCFSSVVELAKVLTPDNRAEVLPRFFHRSKQEAKEVSAELCPRPAPARDVVTVVRPASTPAAHTAPPSDVPAARAAPSTDLFTAPGSAPAAARSVDPVPAAVAAAVAASAAEPAAEPFIRMNADRANPKSQAEPLDGDLRRLHVTVSRRFLAKLDAARDALSHARPDATLEDILEAGLDLLLAERAKRRGEVKKPRRGPPATNGSVTNASVTNPSAATAANAVPAHVKREVWKRAGGRCEFRLASGEACGSTTRLELDHVVPRALGGPSTIDNLRVCCRPHNDLAAREVFGDAWMDRFRKESSAALAPDLRHRATPAGRPGVTRPLRRHPA